MTQAPASIPPDARFHRLIRFLQAATVVAVALAGLALVLPGRRAEEAGQLLVAVLIGAPVVRVAWLGARWWVRGDRRYGLVALALIAVLCGGAVVAALT